MKYLSIALSLIILILGWFIYDRETTASIEKKALESEVRHHKHNADSLAKTYDRLFKEKDSAAFVAFKNAQESANRWEVIAMQSQRDLKHEINKRRSFNDAQTDSLLSSIHPH